MIREIKEKLFGNSNKVEEWLFNASSATASILYSSVDIRNSAYKSSPVDTNLFPAGFNNFSISDHKLASIYLKEFLSKNYPNCKNILVVPEFHTRNKRYIDNLIALNNIFKDTGLRVEFGFIGLEADSINLESSNHEKITAYNIVKKNNKILSKSDYYADLIILNNDLSAGIPEILQDIDIPIIPEIWRGWHIRSKFNHFCEYEKILNQFCSEFSLDPFFLSCIFSKCENVDFKQSIGIDSITKKVEEILQDIEKKYNDYGIKETPYVFIKADNGTYGMGVMTAFSAADVKSANKKMRNKMSSFKNGIENYNFLIQEGIPTSETYNEKSCEPLIYLINKTPFGQTFRIHENKSKYESLNSKDMSFKQNENYSDKDQFLNYTLARLATIAAASEKTN